ncbi:MAG: AbrB/MazE/SpoVT family DNA-binding domain-containing protein [archaeon]|nr:MAG: AbrB/MazE/SpoVT family DNA-binding domain-containing protein [archaeon]
MGTDVGEAVIDERGRIVIPNEIRVELKLRPEQRLKISTKGKELVLSPEVGVDEFASGLRGCVRGSSVKPEDLKTIWGVVHPHH